MSTINRKLKSGRLVFQMWLDQQLLSVQKQPKEPEEMIVKIF